MSSRRRGGGGTGGLGLSEGSMGVINRIKDLRSRLAAETDLSSNSPPIRLQRSAVFADSPGGGSGTTGAGAPTPVPFSYGGDAGGPAGPTERTPAAAESTAVLRRRLAEAERSLSVARSSTAAATPSAPSRAYGGTMGGSAAGGVSADRMRAQESEAVAARYQEKNSQLLQELHTLRATMERIPSGAMGGGASFVGANTAVGAEAASMGRAELRDLRDANEDLERKLRRTRSDFEEAAAARDRAQEKARKAGREAKKYKASTAKVLLELERKQAEVDALEDRLRDWVEENRYVCE